MSRILSFHEYLLESDSSDPIVDNFYSAIKNTQAEESPRGSNKGPEVEPLLKNVGAGPGAPWCVGFVYGVLNKTAFTPAVKSQIPKVAAVKYHWDTTKGKKIKYEPNVDMSTILPGMVFCYLSRDKKKGTYPGSGHTGIVLSVDKDNKTWTGIEGNANPLDGSREGYGTFIVTRNLDDPSISKDPKDHPAKMLGFVDYFSSYRNKPGFTDSLSAKLESLVNELLPKTKKEIDYISKNPDVLKDYENNYNNRNKS
jgi:hypothetical protein